MSGSFTFGWFLKLVDTPLYIRLMNSDESLHGESPCLFFSKASLFVNIVFVSFITLLVGNLIYIYIVLVCYVISTIAIWVFSSVTTPWLDIGTSHFYTSLKVNSSTPSAGCSFCCIPLHIYCISFQEPLLFLLSVDEDLRLGDHQSYKTQNILGIWSNFQSKLWIC